MSSADDSQASGRHGMTGPAANGNPRGPLPEASGTSTAPNGQAPAPGVGERVTPKRDLRPDSGFGPGGRGPMGFMGGMSTQKALNFSGSGKRLLRMLVPERALIVSALVLGGCSVVFSVIGPKVLGNVTNLIFNGFVSSKIPAGVTKAEFIARLRATGHSTQAKLIGALHLTPGHGINFDQVGRTLAVVALIYAAAALCAAFQGRIVAKLVNRAIFAMREQVEAK